MKALQLFSYSSDVYTETEMVIISSLEVMWIQRLWKWFDLQRPRLCTNPKRKVLSQNAAYCNKQKRKVFWNLLDLWPTIGHWDIIYNRYMCLLVPTGAGAVDAASHHGGWSAPSDRHATWVLLVQAINPDVAIYLPKYVSGYSRPWETDPERRLCREKASERKKTATSFSP